MLVICDINVFKQGHYIGFNQFLLQHANRICPMGSTADLLFLFNKEAKQLLAVPAGVNVEYLEIPEQWRHSATGRWKIWQMVNQHMKSYSNAHLYFMDLDKFQFPIGFKTTSFRVSGICFRPHHRISTSNNAVSSRVLSKFKRFKKIVAEKMLLNNRSIQRIFILNDEEGVDYLNKYHQKKLFHYLPDPVFDYDFPLESVSRSTGKFSFLLFGALTERKNIRMLISCFGKAKFTGDTVLHLIGKTDTPEYLESLHKLANESIAGQEHRKTVLFQTDFVSDEAMELHHANTHASLLVYRNFFGSSGLVGRAAKHKQLVLAPSVGLLSEITRKYQLGLTVDPFDQQEIVAAMEKAETMAKQHDFEGAAKFYEEHHPIRFLETLFSVD